MEVPSLRTLLALAGLLTACYAATGQQQVLGQESKQPNIIFILTDDQDLHMDSLSYMPHLKNHLTNQGTSFTRHYCTVALCCPSRVSLWTGKAAHNTNVTDVNPPYGGYPKFISQGFNKDYFPVWMQQLGYATYYVGKLFNAQTVDNYARPTAAGWTGSEFLLDPFTYQYLNASMTRNGAEPVSYEGQYSTDLIKEKSFGFLDDALAEEDGRSFFLTIAPIAPHTNVHIGSNLIDGNFTEHTNVQSPPVAAKRHEHHFEDVTVPRTPHFNPDDPHGVSWIGRLPKQNRTNVESNDHFYRQRLRSLQAVDEMIDELIQRLDTAGILDETYIFFSTDNGYHIGQHRLQPGKQCAFEEDINIPLIVRGPGIPKNHTTDIVTTHTDLAPTFLHLAGSSPQHQHDGLEAVWTSLDGAPIPLHHSTTTHTEARQDRTEHVNVEMWGIIQSEGKFGANLYPNHTYKALRVIGPDYNFLYTVWCSGEHELYDLVADPYEMDNLYARSNHSSTTIPALRRMMRRDAETTDADVETDSEAEAELEADTEEYKSDILPPGISLSTTTTPRKQQQQQQWGREISLEHLIPRLDALVQVLRTCKGWECTHPWRVLHPDGKVGNLRDALDERFDEFYEVQQQRVKFEKCEKGYILESEGPLDVRPYLEGIGG